MAAPLSRSVEDYLKTIYQLSEAGETASTNDIAQQLALSPAAVTGMVKRLAETGHVEHVPYRGARLTPAGRAAALAVVRRHRIIETYLTERLGYGWASVHEEAERLEHAVSDELIERMAASLGDPRYDPHGAPIPTRDGGIEAPAFRPLTEAGIGEPAMVRQVEDGDADRLRYLEALGLVPGTSVVVVGRQPYGGPITLFVGGPGGPERVIGAELAATVRVGPPPG